MIQINFFSARISLDLHGNKPADSAFKSAEIKEDHNEKKNKLSGPASTSNETLVDGESSFDPLPTIDWIAGVGDLSHAASPDSRIHGPLSNQWITRRHPLSSLEEVKSQKPTVPFKPSHLRKNHGPTRSALQRHCDFWDADGDGLIYPWDIYIGFKRLGFHFLLCLWAAVTMAICASYNTHTSWIPHPLFAINIDNMNSNRHGSSTGTYDMDGELDERRFEAIFRKYADGKDYLTRRSVYNVWANQRCANDFFGWFAGGLECEYISS